MKTYIIFHYRSSTKTRVVIDVVFVDESLPPQERARFLKDQRLAAETLRSPGFMQHTQPCSLEEAELQLKVLGQRDHF